MVDGAASVGILIDVPVFLEAIEDHFRRFRGLVLYVSRA
jgi:hypothetical protein